MFDPVQALSEYVRHASVSTDPGAKAGMAGARDFIAGLLRRDLGCEVEIVDTPLHPVVLGHRPGRLNAARHHLGHYDVQPADPLDLWRTPPFEPVVQDGFMFGRGAADNKGPQLVHIAAAANLLSRRPDLPLRLTFLIEGEEEIGSPSFAQVLESHRERLRGDMVMLSDSGSLGPKDIVITTGIRGIVCLEATLTGPKSDLHSGLHGGAVVNPIRALAALCASLHTEDGRVNVPGFYDGVREPEPWEREELARLGQTEAEYAAQIGVSAFGSTPGVTPFEASRFHPTLEYNGIKAVTRVGDRRPSSPARRP
jgi:acetylornithine deacetylase/succinyl-diaminopimelate desuccinylase-like protein